MLVPVILSGGAGTRLWPVSREGHPKPFMKLADGESLLQKTVLRAGRLAESTQPLVVTNRDYYFRSRDDLAEQGAVGRYLLEPVGRNTAPAVLLAALEIVECYGGDARMLVLAADHLIQDQDGFAEAVAKADVLARQGFLVTFGIEPTCPHTGYGYIQRGAALSDNGFRVASFKEKPVREVAEAYLTSGGYDWNSGMFCFTADTVLAAFRDQAPELYQAGLACHHASQGKSAATDALELDMASFAACQDISIDYAIMERASNVAVVPARFDWSDIGAWDAIAQLGCPDDAANLHEGEVISIESHGCYVRAEDRLVAAVGVDDLVIVDTPDALLVTRKDKVQLVKNVVAELKARNHDAYKLHSTVHRPWGTYTVLEEGRQYKIKRIEVKPGASLSLQMHHHRSEHWIVVSGMARVVNGEAELLLRPNESTYIPAGHRHRLENPGVLPLVMIEVQSGEYLGENDIVRFADNYGRQ